jgi:hypothetical protein
MATTGRIQLPFPLFPSPTLAKVPSPTSRLVKKGARPGLGYFLPKTVFTFRVARGGEGRQHPRPFPKMFSPTPFEETHADLLKELVANSERNGENLVLTNKNLWGKNAFPNVRLRF